MTRSSIGIGILIIFLFACQNNAVDYLSDDGYSSSIILLVSSVVMLAISMIACIWKGLSPIPTSWRLQRVRMVCSGLGLYLGILSYQYLHATTACLIFQLNVPFIIIVSALGTRQLDRRLLISIGVISLTFLFFSLSTYSQEPIIGILIAFLAVAVLAMSYLLAKESIAVENQYVIINVTCLSCILVSLISLTLTDQRGWHVDPVDIGLLVSVGLLRYGQNLGLIWFLRLYSTDRSQFPFLLGSVATMFIEMWLEHRLFPVPYIATVLGLTLLVAIIVSIPVREPFPISEKPVN